MARAATHSNEGPHRQRVARVSCRGKYASDRMPYVNQAEKAEISLARQRLDEMAQDTSLPAQAMPAAKTSPFLRYHGFCTRYGCECDAGDVSVSVARALSILNAQYAVYLAAQA
jgi:hypothetical protein